MHVSPRLLLDILTSAHLLCLHFLQAVLLLRPNVSLFSTDALPINCSAYSSNPDARRSPSPSLSQTVPRTCECLTQTLCCHGCGASVGYMIVVPVRCKLSRTLTNSHPMSFYSARGVRRRSLLQIVLPMGTVSCFILAKLLALNDTTCQGK